MTRRCDRPTFSTRNLPCGCTARPNPPQKPRSPRRLAGQPLDEALHALRGLGVPEPAYDLACGLTLAAAIAAFLTGVVTGPHRCERSPLRRVIERGTRLTHHERPLRITWALMGLHSAISVLG